MASGARKWLVGCGIGCGLMILAVGGIGTCGYVGVQKIKDRAERMDEGFEAMVEQYGRPEDFVPPADGAVPAERVETFLAVREAMAPTRDDLADVLNELDRDSQGAGGVLRKVRAGISLVPRLFDFIDERNRVLTDHGMGVGEYLYVYSLAYYAWLDRDPGDGPGFALNDGDEDHNGPGFRWDGDNDDPQDVRERHRAQVRRYLNGVQGQMLANQLDAARAAGLDASWLDRLSAELEAVRADSQRLMWQDGLPEAATAGLEPYRARLEAAYSPVMNVVEMGLVEND